jgi:predicted DNA-binding protein (UPF0278 family)
MFAITKKTPSHYAWRVGGQLVQKYVEEFAEGLNEINQLATPDGNISATVWNRI